MTPFDPNDPDHVRDPDRYLEASRAHCPISTPRDRLHVLVNDEDIRTVLANTDSYSSKGNFRTGSDEASAPFTLITSADDPLHGELRKRMFKNFAPARLRKLRPRVDAIVESALGELPNHGEVDLYRHYVRKIPISVVYTLIGIPEADWSQAQEYGDAIVATVPAPVRELPEFTGLMALLRGVVTARRENPETRHEDVLDNLCFAESGEREMPDLEIVSHIYQLILAGTDTTRSLISNCVWRLLEEPDRWDAVAANRELLPNALEESLRRDSPAQFVVRTARTAGSLHGCPVEPGDKLYLSLQSANHDERRWGEDGDVFDFARQDVTGHLAFGRGIHACIGAPLARIEGLAAVGALLDRFPHMRLSRRAVWSNVDGAITRRPAEVLVDLVPATAISG
ncbi:MAG TPA: cytochrome P450 [Pseudonocardiaceae bacterium]